MFNGIQYQRLLKPCIYSDSHHPDLIDFLSGKNPKRELLKIECKDVSSIAVLIFW